MKIQTIHFAVLLALVGILLAGCGGSGTTLASPDDEGIEDALPGEEPQDEETAEGEETEEVPVVDLQVGASWTYEWSLDRTRVRDGSRVQSKTDGRLMIEVVAEERLLRVIGLDPGPVFRVQVTHHSSGASFPVSESRLYGTRSVFDMHYLASRGPRLYLVEVPVRGHPRAELLYDAEAPAIRHDGFFGLLTDVRRVEGAAPVETRALTAAGFAVRSVDRKDRCRFDEHGQEDCEVNGWDWADAELYVPGVGLAKMTRTGYYESIHPPQPAYPAGVRLREEHTLTIELIETSVAGAGAGGGERGRGGLPGRG